MHFQPLGLDLVFTPMPPVPRYGLGAANKPYADCNTKLALAVQPDEHLKVTASAVARTKIPATNIPYPKDYAFEYHCINRRFLKCHAMPNANDAALRCTAHTHAAPLKSCTKKSFPQARQYQGVCSHPILP